MPQRSSPPEPPGLSSLPPLRLILLGSTGSIGRQTVEVIAGLNAQHARGLFPRRIVIVGLAAGSSADALLAQAAALDVRDLALAETANHTDLARTAQNRGQSLRMGESASERLVREVEADIVLAAVVGFAGLRATLAAVELGLDVALANKETLVAAGSLVTAAAARSGARILPVDSEHSALWQCLTTNNLNPALTPPCALPPSVTRAILTASGGALRDRSKADIHNASPAEALAHPNWSMGAKVTIDSASLTNKALEIIEAHWLFGLEAARIAVLVHPQSIVHAIVEYADGSSIAQLGAPDMRTPIQYALTHPLRPPGPSNRVAWQSLRSLDFAPPDLDRFPALALGYRVIERGAAAGAIFNAANEEAVQAFLKRRIPFGRIPELSAAALDELDNAPLDTLDDALNADAEARRFVAANLTSALAAS